jgi:hypothetical protein
MIDAAGNVIFTVMPFFPETTCVEESAELKTYHELLEPGKRTSRNGYKVTKEKIGLFY